MLQMIQKTFLATMLSSSSLLYVKPFWYKVEEAIANTITFRDLMEMYNSNASQFLQFLNFHLGFYCF